MKKATTEKLYENGMCVGVQFNFANGTKRVILLSELNPVVRAEATAYAITEGHRDTYAGAGSVEEAVAAFDKRRAATIGPNGVYASRGGASIDWLDLIWTAVDRVMPDLADEAREKLEASLDGMDSAGLKAWLADARRKQLKTEVDIIRAERKRRGQVVDIGTLLD